MDAEKLDVASIWDGCVILDEANKKNKAVLVFFCGNDTHIFIVECFKAKNTFELILSFYTITI